LIWPLRLSTAHPTDHLQAYYVRQSPLALCGFALLNAATLMWNADIAEAGRSLLTAQEEQSSLHLRPCRHFFQVRSSA
jgi:hypothetical protein